MTRIHTTALALIGLALPALTLTAHAQVAGFGNGSSFTRTGFTQDNNGNIVDNTPPTISGSTLTLTTAAPGEARAAYTNAPQSVGAFIAQFTYRNDPTSEPTLGAADGFAFVLQNDPRGTSAIGGGGAGLGYGLMNNNQPPTGPPLTPITNSAAVEFFLRGQSGGATTFETGGAIDPNSGAQTGTVNLAGGDPILITLAYDGTTLIETLTDTTTPAKTFTTSYAASIPGAVGKSTAFVGFTGGTGGGYSTQTISGFTFAAAPEPSPLAALGVGLLGLTGLALKARKHLPRSGA